MHNPRKLRPFNVTVTTPVASRTSPQLWAMAFMRRGWMVCTPTMPTHEGPLLDEPVNDNGAKIISLPRRRLTRSLRALP